MSQHKDAKATGVGAKKVMVACRRLAAGSYTAQEGGIQEYTKVVRRLPTTRVKVWSTHHRRPQQQVEIRHWAMGTSLSLSSNHVTLIILTIRSISCTSSVHQIYYYFIIFQWKAFSNSAATRGESPSNQLNLSLLDGLIIRNGL